MKKTKFLAVAVAALFAVPALAQSKSECEATCEETKKICEETMLKKMGKDNKAGVQQVKKACADATKQCKSECK